MLVDEHEMRVVADCDWVIDVSPGAGEEGGRSIASGTPRDVSVAPTAVPLRTCASTCRECKPRAWVQRARIASGIMRNDMAFWKSPGGLLSERAPVAHYALLPPTPRISIHHPPIRRSERRYARLTVRQPVKETA